LSNECITALERGCDLHGITLYPILNHPGWSDDRHCHNGLWDYADATGHRCPDPSLLGELLVTAPLVEAARGAMLSGRAVRTVSGAALRQDT
jgi:hypothetical protein